MEQFPDSSFHFFEEHESDASDVQDANGFDSRELTCADPSTVTEDAEIYRKLLLSLLKHMSRPTFLGVISVYAKTRYTLEGDEHLVSMMMDGDEGICLPSASTMRKTVFPRLLKENFVHSTIETFSTKRTYSISHRRSYKQRKKQYEAVVVHPSAWAKIDIRSLHVLREIACI